MFSRLLVIRPGALGDTLLMAPVLRGLRERPAELVFVGTMPQARLIGHWRLAASVLDFETFNLYQPAAELVAGSTVLLFFKDDRRLAAAFREAKQLQFVEPPQKTSREPAVVHVANQLRRAGIATQPTREPLPIPPAASVQGCEQFAEPFVPGSLLLHAGSGGSAKNWPLERFQAVAERLAPRFGAAYWLLGPAEEESGLVSRLAAGANVLRRLSIEALAGALGSAGMVIGNDSGPVHLAALLGAPTVAVLQASEPAAWAPWGWRAAAVGAPGQPPAAGEVVEAALRLLDEPIRGA